VFIIPENKEKRAVFAALKRQIEKSPAFRDEKNLSGSRIRRRRRGEGIR
jgi:hypothetical protein